MISTFHRKRRSGPFPRGPGAAQAADRREAANERLGGTVRTPLTKLSFPRVDERGGLDFG